MNLSRRQLIAAGCVAAASGGSGAVLLSDEHNHESHGARDRIDLPAVAAAGAPHNHDAEELAILSVTGGLPDTTQLWLRIAVLDGQTHLPADDTAINITNLTTGDSVANISHTVDGERWRLDSLPMRTDGWWQVHASWGDLTASWTLLLPDLNLTGFDTPPLPETDPDAEAMLRDALAVLTGRASLRWWEWLSGGDGSIILARFGVSTPASNGLPPSFENVSLLAGRIPMDGAEAEFRDTRQRMVTVGEQGRRIVGTATAEAISPVSYLPIGSYDTTYADCEGVAFGTTAAIEGIDCQLITFHLPGTTEAWFASWIEQESLTLREVLMISANHYMRNVYFDIDEPFEIELDTP